MTAIDTTQEPDAPSDKPKRWQLWAFLGTTDRAAANANYFGVDLGPVARCATALGAASIAEELGAVHVLNDAQGDCPCYDARTTEYLLHESVGGAAVTVCSHAFTCTDGKGVLGQLMRTVEEAFNGEEARQQRAAGMVPVYLLSGGTPLHAGVLLMLAHRPGYEGDIIQIDHATSRVTFLDKFPR